MEVSSDVTAPGTNQALGSFGLLDLGGLEVSLLPWGSPSLGKAGRTPEIPLLLNPQGLCFSIGQIFLPQTKHTKHYKFNEMSFLTCLCYITDEANKHIQMGVESKAAPSPALPEDVADAGEGR